MSRSYSIWNEVVNPDLKTDKSHGVDTYEQNNIKIGTSKSNSFDFLETKLETFTQADGTKVYLFYIDGELVKEASYNIHLSRFEMRSKIHPRDFYQKDMLFDFSTKNTVVCNRVGGKFIKHNS